MPPTDYLMRNAVQALRQEADRTDCVLAIQRPTTELRDRRRALQVRSSTLREAADRVERMVRYGSFDR